MRERESGTSCSTLENGGRGHEGFAESTAKATGKTKQDTNRATKRAREVCQQARRIAVAHKKPARPMPSGLPATRTRLTPLVVGVTC